MNARFICIPETPSKSLALPHGRATEQAEARDSKPARQQGTDPGLRQPHEARREPRPPDLRRFNLTRITIWANQFEQEVSSSLLPFSPVILFRKTRISRAV